MEQVVDTYLASAIKLLHSSAPDSAEKIRNLLEAEILKNYDKSQTLSSKLTKKQMTDLLHQETKAIGSGGVKRKTKKIEEKTDVLDNEQIIKIRDDDESSEDDDEDASTSAAMLLDDLSCKICRGMDTTTGNQLLECSACSELYHVLCNSSKVPSDVSTFVCSVCKAKKDKEGSSKSNKSYDSSNSSSSTSLAQSKKEREKEKPSDKKKSSESTSSSSKKESTSSRSRSSKK